MNDDLSLDRLHDIVVPDAVSWWPPAPGWFVVFALLLVGLLWFLIRRWQRWQQDAYRRAALEELRHADSPVRVAEVLRRTALMVAPRSVMAAQSGDDWIDWLQSMSTNPVPDEIRAELTEGLYRGGAGGHRLTELQSFAVDWVRNHRLPISKED